jgi:hypothetical protein
LRTTLPKKKKKKLGLIGIVLPNMANTTQILVKATTKYNTSISIGYVSGVEISQSQCEGNDVEIFFGI